MGFFTKEKYSYWQCSVDNKKCTVSMIAMDSEELDRELNKAIENVQKFEKEKSDLQSQRKNAKDNEEVSKINRKILDVESQYRTVYANGKTLEDKIGYYKRYNSIVYEVMRLKDIYTREEAVRIQIINNGIVDGCIITSTNKIGEDIYKLEKYGISMSPLYFDELAKIIKNNYFDIEPTEREYIDNEISENAVQAFVEFCRQKMGKTLGDYISKDGVYYDVKTTDITSWYKECPVRRFNLRDIKEALIIYGYVSKPTKGRTDCTINGQKVLRFCKEIMDKIEYVEDDNE